MSRVAFVSSIQVEDFLRLELHAESHLHGLDAGFERIVVAAAFLRCFSLRSLHQVHLLALRVPARFDCCRRRR